MMAESFVEGWIGLELDSGIDTNLEMAPWGERLSKELGVGGRKNHLLLVLLEFFPHTASYDQTSKYNGNNTTDIGLTYEREEGEIIPCNSTHE